MDITSLLVPPVLQNMTELYICIDIYIYIHGKQKYTQVEPEHLQFCTRLAWALIMRGFG